MSKQNKIIIVSIALVAIISVTILLSRQNFSSPSKPDGNYGSTKTSQIEVPITSPSDQKIADSSTKAESKDTMEASTNNMPEKSVTDTKTTVNVESGYTIYNKDKLTNAKYGKVILFFHASWCPSCKALDSNIKSNINSIPNDVLILKVDYDASNDLKQKYGVTSQHTLVQVNENGDLIKSSKGLYQLNTLESVIQNF